MDFLPPLCKNNSNKTNPNRVALAADGSSNAVSRKSRCCSSLGPEVTQLCCWHSVKELLEMLSGRLIVQSTLKCFLINGTASSGLLQRHTMSSGTVRQNFILLLLLPQLSSLGAFGCCRCWELVKGHYTCALHCSSISHSKTKEQAVMPTRLRHLQEQAHPH